MTSELIKSCNIKGKHLYRVKLQIADIVIQIESRFKGELFTEEDSWRYENFIHRGNKEPHIVLKVKVVDRLPELNGAKKLFTTIHPESKDVNWGLYRKDSRYILKTFVEEKKQYIVLNSRSDRGVVYVQRHKNKDAEWKLLEIIYDALQIILINYLTQKDGIIVHAVGVKDVDGTGRIFIGESDSGKSTLARLWNNYSRAVVLNDDRIIIRKIKESFFIYGSPWHGDFSDYLISKIDSAEPVNLLFIRHSKNNILNPISKGQAFTLLYPNIFPTFWDKKGLNKTISFCIDVIGNLPCYSLGFKNDKNVISFSRKIKT
jgi:hypothetical protein